MQKATDSTIPTSANAEGRSIAPAVDDDTSIVFDKKSHVKTEGEKRFDWQTYGVVGYLINALISVGAVWGVERTATGKKLIEKAANGITKTLNMKSNEWPKFFLIKTFFLAGGFAVMIPMKWMEDRKLEHIKQLNREIYGEKANTDPGIVRSEKELAVEPKQNWASLLGSRMLSLVPFYLGYWLIWERKSPLAKLTNPALAKMTKEAIKTMEHDAPGAFSAIAEKSIYVDNPIAKLARPIGRTLAYVTGGGKEIKHIDAMGQMYKGTIKHGIKGEVRDPWQVALPYYTMSEAITSGMVAWGVYALTRVLGPIIGTKDHVPQAKPVTRETVQEHAPIMTKPVAEDPAKASALEQPQARISVAALTHQPPFQQSRQHD